MYMICGRETHTIVVDKDMRELGKYLLIAGTVWGAWYLYRQYGGRLPVIPSSLTNSTNTNSNNTTTTTNQDEYYRTLEQVIAIEQQHPDWKQRCVQNNKDVGYIVAFFDDNIDNILAVYKISKETYDALIARGYEELPS